MVFSTSIVIHYTISGIRPARYEAGFAEGFQARSGSETTGAGGSVLGTFATADPTYRVQPIINSGTQFVDLFAKPVDGCFRLEIAARVEFLATLALGGSSVAANRIA
ncbi:MAG TPA: hypothetical protein VMR62_36285 [Bryobacteraceae bacterium]|jgi:hypothetical protein|nr:hypothetical protein [Bryobacteraceae bacterium]